MSIHIDTTERDRIRLSGMFLISEAVCGEDSGIGLLTGSVALSAQLPIQFRIPNDVDAVVSLAADDMSDFINELPDFCVFRPAKPTVFHGRRLDDVYEIGVSFCPFGRVLDRFNFQVFSRRGDSVYAGALGRGCC